MPERGGQFNRLNTLLRLEWSEHTEVGALIGVFRGQRQALIVGQEGTIARQGIESRHPLIGAAGASLILESSEEDTHPDTGTKLSVLIEEMELG